MVETVSGEVSRITYESEETGFRVLQVEVAEGAMVTVVGKVPFVAIGTRVRVTGERRVDPKHGEQLRVHTLVPLEPNTLAGLERYLGSGLIPGVGPALAGRIVARFGLETLDILDRSPHRLREVPGLGERRLSEIRARWGEQRALSDLNVLLASHGISSALARRIFERYGDDTAQIVQNHPYRLAMDVRGIGFRTADRIARHLNIDRDHPERVRAGVFHLLHEYAERGHVFVTAEELGRSTAALLSIDEEHVPPALDSLYASERVVIERNVTLDAGEGVVHCDAVFLRRFHQAERELAERLCHLKSVPAVKLSGVEDALRRFEQQAGVELEVEQRRAVHTAANEKFLVVTGGPGVGKTTIVRAILDVFRRQKLVTLLAAPTGRAAKRLADSTGRPASTLHRLLEFDPVTRSFKRDAERPLEAQAIIVDEASMIDLLLARALVSALPDRARLVIVGDADQLPSVAAGAVLRDVIASGTLPVVALTRVFRQAEQSSIVENAHAILRGREPASASANEPDSDFFVIERCDAEHAAATVLSLVTRRIPQRFGFDPRSQVSVLSPMHRGPCGTTSLNRRLQEALNPSGDSLVRGGGTFRVGDRVMQLRNNYERDVYNGDQGRVLSVDAANETLTVVFEDRQLVYTAAEIDDVTLAYATTIHKSQGSEYAAVVVPLLMSHFVMLSRNLLYTAVTRGRKLCVLVADPKALRIALSEVRRERRNTRLEARLCSLVEASA